MYIITTTAVTVFGHYAGILLIPTCPKKSLSQAQMSAWNFIRTTQLPVLSWPLLDLLWLQSLSCSHTRYRWELRRPSFGHDWYKCHRDDPILSHSRGTCWCLFLTPSNYCQFRTISSLTIHIQGRCLYITPSLPSTGHSKRHTFCTLTPVCIVINQL